MYCVLASYDISWSIIIGDAIKSNQNGLTTDDAIVQPSTKLFLNYRHYNAYREIQTKFYYQKTRSRITLIRRKWSFRSVIPENFINIRDNVSTPYKYSKKIHKKIHCVETVYLWCQYEKLCYNEMVLDFNVYKINAPVCNPVSVCGHFFIFSSFDEANDKKPYDNDYKHYLEWIRIRIDMNWGLQCNNSI